MSFITSPSKMAAIEARWHDEQPASEVLLAWPDVENQRNLFAITLPPPFGSLIDSDSFTAAEVGLNSIPRENWPPVLIPFFTFRIMVGCGLIMLLVAWIGSYLEHKGRLERNRPLLWLTFLSFPLPFIAILTGWYTAEVGRQPWVVYGVLRTCRRDDALPDDSDGDDLARGLLRRLQLHFRFRRLLHLSLLRAGPAGRLVLPTVDAVPNRPMSVVAEPADAAAHHPAPGE